MFPHLRSEFLVCVFHLLILSRHCDVFPWRLQAANSFAYRNDFYSMGRVVESIRCHNLHSNNSVIIIFISSVSQTTIHKIEKKITDIYRFEL